MKKLLGLAGVGMTALMLSSQFASSFTLLNNDSSSYKVEITETVDPSEIHVFELTEGEEVYDLCDEGCILRLNDGEPYEFTGNEDVYIENGELVYEP